jgi:AAA15 family ATPase/GTPase
LPGQTLLTQAIRLSRWLWSLDAEIGRCWPATHRSGRKIYTGDLPRSLTLGKTKKTPCNDCKSVEASLNYRFPSILTGAVLFDGVTVILSFGFRNFFSFREDVEISFKLDAKCPETISKKKDFSRVLGIKGANGSGKTQILKGLSFISTFTTDSFNNTVDAPIGLAPFFDSTEPTFFFIDFRIGRTDYRYELSCTPTAIVSEIIYRTVKKRSIILERKGNTLSYVTGSMKRLSSVKLRKNASIISTAHQYELPDLKAIYEELNYFETNVNFAGFQHTLRDTDFVSEFLANTKDPEILKFIIKFIKECDTGVTNIKIRSFVDKNGIKQFFPIFYHLSDGEDKPVTAHTESSGTKALFQMLTNYYLTRKIGGVLIVDEFDINLHPDILPKLIALFDDEDQNPLDAQLIFATHDSEVLEVLGRYRTYLVAKDKNESYAYRLDEIPGDLLRNDRLLRPVYVSGRIGGVPREISSEL